MCFVGSTLVLSYVKWWVNNCKDSHNQKKILIVIMLGVVTLEYLEKTIVKVGNQEKLSYCRACFILSKFTHFYNNLIGHFATLCIIFLSLKSLAAYFFIDLITG